MKLAMIGLGRMGGNMTTRLLNAGHEMVVFNRSQGPMAKAEAEGAKAASNLKAVVQALEPPRVVWVMLPAGEVTETTLRALGQLVEKGDIIVDGGNSHYTDTLRRGDELEFTRYRIRRRWSQRRRVGSQGRLRDDGWRLPQGRRGASPGARGAGARA